MRASRSLNTLTALLVSLPAVILPASIASAITADEVWAEWQRVASKAQIPLNATTRREGDRLVLTGIAINLNPDASPEDPVILRLDRLDLKDQGDGTVRLLMRDSFPLTLDLPPSPEPNVPDKIIFTVSAPDFSFVISGLGDTAAYDVSAATVLMTPEQVIPAPKDGAEFDFNLAAADLAFRYQHDLAAPTIKVSTDFNLGTLHADIAFAVPSERSEGSFSFDLSKITADIEAVIPPSANKSSDTASEPSPEEVLKPLADGLLLHGTIKHGPFSLKGDAQEGDEKAVDMEFTSASGLATGKLDKAGVIYEVASGKTLFKSNLDVSADSSGEFIDGLNGQNIEAGYTELSYGLSFGIGDLTVPQTASLKARLTDLFMPDVFWAQVDPKGLFPHEPISTALSASGTYALDPVMLEPGWTPDPDGFLPVDITASLEELLFSGFGVKVTGSGALTFDEKDLATFGGFPTPDGKLSFLANGVNSLIERIEKAGLVSADELTGIRLGLAFIAKPGKTPDSLTSNIEFREKSLYLNGQKLR
jgi:hypothetical protein